MEDHVTPRRVVIVGGGFAGLFAARALRRAPKAAPSWHIPPTPRLPDSDLLFVVRHGERLVAVFEGNMPRPEPGDILVLLAPAEDGRPSERRMP